MKSTDLPQRFASIARVVAAVAVLAGLAASASLLAPYVFGRGLCTAHGCDDVARSVYGRIFGIPRAAIGVAAFAAALFFVLAGSRRVRTLAPLVGVLAAIEGAHLLYVQKFVLHTWCPFCIVADVSGVVLGLALFAEALVTWRSSAERVPRLAIRGTTAGAIAGVLAFLVPLGVAARKPGPRSVSIDPVTGEGGKIVVREFVDLECPFCRATHIALSDAIGTRSDVVVERHHVPYPQHHHAMDAAVAACCAGEQGVEDKFVDGVIRTPNAPDESVCRAVAKSLSLDLSQWDACRSSPRPKERIDKDVALADQTGVDALPTIDVEGERIVGELDSSSAAALLARHSH